MHALTADLDRAVRRASELTAELADVLRTIRQAGSDGDRHPGPEAPAVTVDQAVLEQLANDLGGTEEVATLVNGYAMGLDARARQYLAGCAQGDDVLGQRLFRDLRSSSELVGATAIVEWCGRRSRGEAAHDAELLTLVEQTRRSLTVWRLSLP